MVECRVGFCATFGCTPAAARLLIYGAGAREVKDALPSARRSAAVWASAIQARRAAFKSACMIFKPTIPRRRAKGAPPAGLSASRRVGYWREVGPERLHVAAATFAVGGLDGDGRLLGVDVKRFNDFGVKPASPLRNPVLAATWYSISRSEPDIRHRVLQLRGGRYEAAKIVSGQGPALDALLYVRVCPFR